MKAAFQNAAPGYSHCSDALTSNQSVGPLMGKPVTSIQNELPASSRENYFERPWDTGESVVKGLKSNVSNTAPGQSHWSDATSIQHPEELRASSFEPREIHKPSDHQTSRDDFA